MDGVVPKFPPPFGEEPHYERPPRWVPLMVVVFVLGVLVVLFVFRAPPFHSRPSFFGDRLSVADTKENRVIPPGDRETQQNLDIMPTSAFLDTISREDLVSADSRQTSTIATGKFLTNESQEDVFFAFVNWLDDSAVELSIQEGSGGALALHFINKEENRFLMLAIIEPDISGRAKTSVIVQTPLVQ